MGDREDLQSARQQMSQGTWRGPPSLSFFVSRPVSTPEVADLASAALSCALVCLVDRLVSTNTPSWFRTSFNRSEDSSSIFPLSLSFLQLFLPLLAILVSCDTITSCVAPSVRSREETTACLDQWGETVHVLPGTPLTSLPRRVGLAPWCQRRVKHVTLEKIVLVAA